MSRRERLVFRVFFTPLTRPPAPSLRRSVCCMIPLVITYGMGGLKYHPTTGIFYGATATTSPTNPDYLVIVDPATALVTPIGPFGARSLTDIAIDPTTGIMYGVSGYNQKFYTINTSTGQAVQTGQPGLVSKRRRLRAPTGRERLCLRLQ